MFSSHQIPLAFHIKHMRKRFNSFWSYIRCILNSKSEIVVALMIACWTWQFIFLSYANLNCISSSYGLLHRKWGGINPVIPLSQLSATKQKSLLFQNVAVCSRRKTLAQPTAWCILVCLGLFIYIYEGMYLCCNMLWN